MEHLKVEFVDNTLKFSTNNFIFMPELTLEKFISRNSSDYTEKQILEITSKKYKKLSKICEDYCDDDTCKTMSFTTKRGNVNIVVGKDKVTFTVDKESYGCGGCIIFTMAPHLCKDAFQKASELTKLLRVYKEVPEYYDDIDQCDTYENLSEDSDDDKYQPSDTYEDLSEDSDDDKK